MARADKAGQGADAHGSCWHSCSHQVGPEPAYRFPHGETELTLTTNEELDFSFCQTLLMS